MAEKDPPTDPIRIRTVGIVFVASFALYAITCAPGVVWQDSAVFQMRVAQFDLHSNLGLALAHPLYIVLCKLFTILPLGTQALRVNLFSGFCAAACLAILVDVLLNITRNRATSLVAVALLAVSHTFWKHAVLAEVMTLYGLELAAELWLIERFFARGRASYLIAAFFVNGLGASNHLLALLHLPAYGILILWLASRRQLRWSVALKCAAAYLVGVSPYLALCMQELLRGRGAMEVIHSALFGEGFSSSVLNTSIAFKRQSLKAAEYFALNFPTPLVLAAIAGIPFILRRGREGTVAAFAAGIFAVAFVFAFRYPVPDQYVFFFPCYILTALFVGLGMSRIGRPKPFVIALFPILALVPAVVYEAVPGLLQRYHVSVPFRQDVPYRDAYAYFLRPRMNGDDGAERFAREALGAMPNDGLLIADSSENNVLAYVRDVEGVRRDVALSVPCDAALAAPTADRSNREGVRRFLDAGLAYSATGDGSYVPEWMKEGLEFNRAGIIFKLAPKRGLTDGGR